MRDDDKDNSSPKAHLALKALQSVGGLNGWTIFYFVLLAGLVNILSVYAQNILSGLYDAFVAGWFVMPVAPEAALSGLPAGTPNSGKALLVAGYNLALFVLVLLPFLIIVGQLKRLAEKRLSEMRPKVLSDYPSPAKVIVMFVSPANVSLHDANDIPESLKKRAKENPSQEMVDIVKNIQFVNNEMEIRKLMADISKECDAKQRAEMCKALVIKRKNAYTVFNVCSDASEAYVRALFNKANWRMNVEALRPHIMDNSRLEKIILISTRNTATGTKGSHAQIDAFRSYLCAFLKNHKCEHVDILLPHQLSQIGRSSTIYGLTHAVSGENMSELVEILYRINSLLRKKPNYYQEEEILLDITSGKSIATAAGMAFATLVESRRVQYVDTNDYSINDYDVVHDVDQANP